MSLSKISSIIKKATADTAPVLTTDRGPEELFLKQSEIQDIATAFQLSFPTLKIIATDTEVFCNRLLPFADVIISHGYAIKFRHGQRDSLALMAILDSLDLDGLHHNYTRQLTGNPVQPKVLLFIPEQVDSVDNLITDYLTITKNILEKSPKSVGNRGVRQ